MTYYFIYLMWVGAAALMALFVYFGFNGYSSGKRSPAPPAQLVGNPAPHLK